MSSEISSFFISRIIYPPKFPYVLSEHILLKTEISRSLSSLTKTEKAEDAENPSEYEILKGVVNGVYKDMILISYSYRENVQTTKKGLFSEKEHYNINQNNYCINRHFFSSL